MADHVDRFHNLRFQKNSHFSSFSSYLVSCIYSNSVIWWSQCYQCANAASVVALWKNTQHQQQPMLVISDQICYPFSQKVGPQTFPWKHDCLANKNEYHNHVYILYDYLKSCNDNAHAYVWDFQLIACAVCLLITNTKLNFVQIFHKKNFWLKCTILVFNWWDEKKFHVTILVLERRIVKCILIIKTLSFFFSSNNAKEFFDPNKFALANSNFCTSRDNRLHYR